MTPGPVEVSPRVLASLAQPAIYHYYPEFVNFYEETTKKIQKIFQTRNDVLILQGEGVLGLEAGVVCSINRGEKVLVFENGPFGKWLGDYVKNAGGTPVYFHSETNVRLNVNEAIELLEKNKDATAITLVHCETPAVILNDIVPICKHARNMGMLTIVDTVASLGGTNVRPDEWGIDICVSASQKCLGSTAGLTPMSISDFAWEKITHKKEPIRVSYLSLLDWKETWLSSKRFPFTPFTAEINALGAAADEILEERLENVFRRHAEVASLCRKGVVAMGLKLWPLREEFCSPTVTAISIPEHYSDNAIITQMAMKHKILIGGGYRELKGQVLRIGHMGYQAQLAFVAATLDALSETVKSMRQPVKAKVPTRV
jgi:aspartate aminotransferase-like enzyme